MKKAVIDLTDCKYLVELHRRIKEALDFPEWYGENWDAFWDLLNRDCAYNFITVKGASTVAEELKPSVKMMREIMERDKKFWANSDYPVDYEFID